MDSTAPLSEKPDRDDPLFLFSQSLDGPLTARERARLDDALARSPALRARAAELAWVQDLIAATGDELPEIDSPTFVDLTAASAAYDDDADMAVVDRWLDTYGREGPEIDSDVFVRSVLAKTAASPIRRLVWPLRLRRYVQLAAAASVLLAVTGYMGYRATRQGDGLRTGRSIVMYDRMPNAAVANASHAVIRSNVVAFAMSDPVRPGGSVHSDRVEIIAVGSEDAAGWSESVPPL